MQRPVRERRASPRYPIPVPLRFRQTGIPEEERSHVGDLSAGGLSFRVPDPIPEGSRIEVVFPLEDTRFELAGSVVECLGDGEGFRVGVCFQEPETRFRAKLAEQVLRIHELRRELSQLRDEEVTTEEAARDWVAHYAREFAGLYEG